METVVLALMLIVVFMTWLKLTFLRLWQMAAVAAICAAFTALSWQYAIEQSNNEISQWLSNQQLMLDTAVILTLEVVWQISYCMLAASLLYGGRVGRRTLLLYHMLRFFPGILILPVLFFLLVKTIYLFTGTDFAFIAYSLALAELILIPAGSYGLRRLVPEKALRLELLFLTSALVLILGIIVTVNGTTSFKGSDPVEWHALAAFAGLALACAIAGYSLRTLKLKRQQR